MQIVESINSLKKLVNSYHQQNQTIALCPTTGGLHAGHSELFKIAREKADVVIATIFVNPLQFALNESTEVYSKLKAKDLLICQEHQVDVVFIPELTIVYPNGFSTHVVELTLSKELCGPSRPNYFKGVTTLMTIYLNTIRPHCLCLGQKNALLLGVIKKMIQDLHIDVQLLIAPTIRDEGGLALSARYNHLNELQKTEARKVYQSLVLGQSMFNKGITSVDRIIAEVTHQLSQSLKLRPIYVNIIDSESMRPMNTVIPRKSLLVAAAWLDDVRLVDNLSF